MVRIPLFAAVLLALLAGCATAPSSTSPAPEVERTRRATSGVDRHVGVWYDIEADCRSNGEVKLTTANPPAHGTVRYESVMQFVRPDHPELQGCMNRQVPVNRITYRSTRGFSGEDRFTVATQSPTGTPKLVTYVIEVALPTSAYRVDPIYPEEARLRGIEGAVVTHVVVEADGSVSSVRIIRSPDAMLSDSAVRALKQWRFNPEPTGFVGEYEVVYRLTDPLPSALPKLP